MDRTAEEARRTVSSRVEPAEVAAEVVRPVAQEALVDREWGATSTSSGRFPERHAASRGGGRALTMTLVVVGQVLWSVCMADGAVFSWSVK
jgi:hypothetical protein